MSSHVIAFTAKFKIDAVRKGNCVQTIRPKRVRPIKEDDDILLHGWERQPYYSKWSWRLNAVCMETIPILFKHFERNGWLVMRTDYNKVVNPDILAKHDGFDSVYDMFEWFSQTYRWKTNEQYEFDVIRWRLV